MKVHRIITTIEVENDNSSTSIELINLHLANADTLFAITDITTNGNAEDITKIYDSVNKSRLGIAGKLKGIAHIINAALTQSGVRGESPIEPDGTSKTS